LSAVNCNFLICRLQDRVGKNKEKRNEKAEQKNANKGMIKILTLVKEGCVKDISFGGAVTIKRIFNDTKS
jgi:hypothetical protein